MAAREHQSKLGPMSTQASRTTSRAGAPSSAVESPDIGSPGTADVAAAAAIPVQAPASGDIRPSEASPGGPQPAFAGWARIDGDNVLRGWATDRQDRAVRATVDIYIDDEPVAALRADLFDPKLVELGEDDGRYAFALVIPAEYRDGREHRFEVIVRGIRFALRSKQPTFVIAPDQTLPSLDIHTVALAGIRGVLVGGQYSKAAALHLWRDGERLDLAFHPVWSGGHEVREFYFPFTPDILAALRESDLLLSASGMVEAGLGGAIISRIETSLAATCDDNGVLTLTLGSPFAPDIGEVEVEVSDAFGRESLVSAAVVLYHGVGQMVLPAEILDQSLTVSVAVPDVSLPAISANILRSVGRLNVNGSFQFWSGSGPSDWECPGGGDRLVRGYYAFPARIAQKCGVSGDYAHFDGGVSNSETVLLRQPLNRIPRQGQPVDAAVLFRSAAPVRVRLRLVDEEGAEIASMEAESRRDWAWVFTVAPITLEEDVEGPIYFEVLVGAGEVAVDIAGARLGGYAFIDSPAPENPDIAMENLVENADLTAWPRGLKVSLVGRGEMAAGWFAFNRRSVEPMQARAILGETDSDQIGLAFAAETVPEYCRLEVRLHAPTMSTLEHGVLRFEAGTPAAARRLFSASAVALPEFILIERIMLLRRSSIPSANGFSLVDETVAVVGRKLVVSRRFNEVELSFSTTRQQDIPEFDWEIEDVSADKSEYFMVFEFRQAFAVAFRGVSVTVGVPEPAQTDMVPYLALEDRNISAQVEHIRGLSSWVGSAVIDPAVTTSEGGGEETELHRWRWSAASTGSVEVVVCVYNAIDETLACLRSLTRSTRIPHTVRIIDDGSGPTVHRRLADFVSDKPWMTLSANPENRGYTYSADRGVRESDADWVVLLNSDTIVTPGWLEGMMECAISDPSVAFVGPLSNAATFQSVPDLYDSRNQWKTNDLPLGWTPARMAALLREASVKAFPDAPLLNGFCTLMRRAVFLEVGGLNHSAFPTGYGEENDLCLRVRKAGYRLALADHVYVYHSKSASFGSARRTELAKAGGKALKELHPDVNLGALTAGFRDIPALVSLRAAVRSAYENQL